MINDYHPERLKHIYIVNAEFLLNIAYKLIKPFLNKVLLEKIQIIDEKELIKYIDKDQLLKRYGGERDEPEIEELFRD